MDRTSTTVGSQQAISDTLRWLERAVIGLNLCPFAKAPHVKGRIHFATCVEPDDAAWRVALEHQLQALVERPAAERETTLLVVPNALHDFLDFNDRLAVGDQMLHDLGLIGVIQIASFHPRYQFAGTAPDDITNYTNRSPHPLFHLIREASIDQALTAFARPESIYETNVRTLSALGHAGWQALELDAPA